MTILIAAREGDSVWIAADSAVTSAHADVRLRNNHLKLARIGGGVAGFAGDVEAAERAFDEASSAESSADDVVERLRLASASGAVDFAFAVAVRDGAPRLVRVTHGQVDSPDAFHLGSHDAFEAVQRVRHAELDFPPDSHVTFLIGGWAGGHALSGCSRCVVAMQHYFAGATTKEAGGFVSCYSVSGADAEFLTYAYSTTDPIASSLRPGDPLPRGTAQGGGFGVSVCELGERDGVVLAGGQGRSLKLKARPNLSDGAVSAGLPLHREKRQASWPRRALYARETIWPGALGVRTMRFKWSTDASEWLLRRPIVMSVALLGLTAVAVILVAHWPDSYATNAAFLVIGAWVSIIGMVVVEQSQRVHDKEALSKVLHTELAEQLGRLVHDAERGLKPGAEVQPWNAFRLRKFAPARAKIYEASAGSLSMLDGGDAGAISRFYYRVDAMARDLNQIADQAGENVTATQVKLIQKRLRQAITVGLPALEGLGARVPGAISIEQEAVDGYLEEGEASDVGRLRSRARTAMRPR